MLYWKRILSEAGIDWTDVGRLVSDRSGWKKLVKERMDHLDVSERQLAHGYVWRNGEERLVRNERRVNEDLRCRYEGADVVGWVGGDVGRGVDRRVSCQYCGRVVTIRNMARHLRQSSKVCDPGGEPTAVD